MAPMSCSRWRLLGLVAVALVLCGFTPEEGRQRALHDLAAHHPHWYLIGYPAHGYVEYGRVLRERYGVTLELAGCNGHQPGIRAYNAVIEEALDRRYGRGVLARAWAAAQVIVRRGDASGPNVPPTDL